MSTIPISLPDGTKDKLPGNRHQCRACHLKALDNGTPKGLIDRNRGRRSHCANCERPFQPTVRRRLLCLSCFQSTNELDPLADRYVRRNDAGFTCSQPEEGL